jgi:hypothetical protein
MEIIISQLEFVDEVKID